MGRPIVGVVMLKLSDSLTSKSSAPLQPLIPTKQVSGTLYYARPISPANNPRSNVLDGNLQKHRREPVDTGEYLQLAGHLCPSCVFSGDAPERAADWTPTPYNGLDAMNPGDAGDPVGDDPPAWCALPPSARPIPICYGVDWTRHHISPVNNLGIRHPQDGTALPWLARYPNGGVHLLHPVVNPGARNAR